MSGDQVQIITSASRANIKIFAEVEFFEPAGKNFYNDYLGDLEIHKLFFTKINFFLFFGGKINFFGVQINSHL